MPQIRVLTLNKNQFNESLLFRLEKGWTLQFVLGPTLVGHSVHLFSNYPPNPGQTFDRQQWYELEWVTSSKHKNDDLDKAAEIQCELAGSFGYFFICDTKDQDDRCGFGYFQVAPTLTVGPEDEELPLDCIQCQTVLAKCLGPFPEWESRLRVALESGYNMIHVTPTQTLGISNSSYSICNQLELNPLFYKNTSQTFSYSDVKKLVDKMKNEWSILTISDVVWNHTAKNSQWVQEHPESGFNLQNSPHLRPAFLLDRVLTQFGDHVARGNWMHKGLPALLTEENHLNAMRSILFDEILPTYRFHEFFQVNVDHVANEFIKLIESGSKSDASKDGPLKIIQDPEYRRFGSTVDLQVALANFCKDGCSNPSVKNQCIADFRHNLVELNNRAAAECWDSLCAAVNALTGHVRYERVDGHGPKYRDYNEHHPLFSQYFTHGKVADLDLKAQEAAMYDNTKNAYNLAFNGWVMNDDALKNFAEPPSMVYFRRELICWGDSVKLRFGQKPEDCPFLWNYMKEYTRITAETFHGIRLDNCHSTPIHVAEYLIDYARTVRPDLYICAELFTGREHVDNIFVNRLGISSLVREAQSAGNAHEQGRLVYRYGGDPVGAFIQKVSRPLVPSIAHAIFLDLTHDNPCPITTRTIYDMFPTAALVSAACCATGSNRGYDELITYHIHVVNEKRLYCKWTESSNPAQGEVNFKSGIVAGRKAINDLHAELGQNGFNEIFVDQVTEDVVAVTRHNPKSRQSVIVVARTCFRPDKVGRICYIKPLKVSGTVDEIIFEGKLVAENNSSQDGRPKPRKSDSFLLGDNNYRLEIKNHIKVINSDLVELNVDGNTQEIEFTNFPPGAVIAVRVLMHPQAKTASNQLRQCLTDFGYRMRSVSFGDAQIEKNNKGTDLRSIVSRLSFQDFNRILFRCHEEEADEGKGGGVYHTPKMEPFIYCGLAGLLPRLTAIRLGNDLGHPLCDNLRQGDWLPRYVAERLLKQPGTKELGLWYSEIFDLYAHLPHYLKPCFFEAIISGSYEIICEALWIKMSQYVHEGSKFVKVLALSAAIFAGYCRSALLPPLADNVQPPHPPTVVNESTGKREQACTSLAAGLPHFAAGLFRNWGRDTFISLPGVMLIPGRLDEARYIILAYGGCLRHGLIPNLMGSGICARFNCRDAVWWWLQAIKCYCELAPNGKQILQDHVKRLYPTDDANAGDQEKIEPLHATIQEALSRHFNGIKFRERNAGHAIDEHMKDEGFNLEAGVNLETGFVYGGNQWNCGTWMDKMGSSDQAGTRGKPATPRDGSAVELVGLCYSVVKWLHQLSSVNDYPHQGVTRTSDNITWTWKQWADKIQQNFERYFWIPLDEHEQLDSAINDLKLINARGIYKDSYKSSLPWADYQFRPNFPITLTVAPDLVTPEKALIALSRANQQLKGPLGMKTLDPSDWAYNGYYNNADNSSDARISRGFNYHQGPEWLWVTGYFLRARLRIADKVRQSQPQVWDHTVSDVKQALSHHFTHIQESWWKSLPELTNKDGSVCNDACPAQAWSVGCILEVMHDLSQYA